MRGNSEMRETIIIHINGTGTHYTVLMRNQRALV